MKKKVLLISVSAGAGHVRAANALEKEAKKNFPEIEVTHIDMLDYVTLPMKKAIFNSYDIMVKQLPELWGFLYKQTDKPGRTSSFRELTKKVGRMNANKLYNFVKEHGPDYIICTHFLPAQTLLEAPTRFKTKAPISIVMTDYAKHSLLMTPGMDHYFVATNKMKWKMEKIDIPGESISVSGIPIDPIFYNLEDKNVLKDKYNINKNNQVLLLLSGGQGMVKIDKITEALFETKKPATIIAIAGKNRKLESSLNKIKAPSHIELRAVGWTNKIHEYMNMSDIIITKPGGLTTSECIALKKPIIAVEPIPGQEEHNAEYILENKYGFIAHSILDIQYYSERMGYTNSTPEENLGNATKNIWQEVTKKL